MAHYDIPLDLPHAGTLASRILTLLERRLEPGDDATDRLLESSEQLDRMLTPYRANGENPIAEEAERVRQEAAELGRSLVDQIEALGAGHDRLGQFIRNLFECLELGKEGAEISLRAGEDPGSLQRPYEQ